MLLARFYLLFVLSILSSPQKVNVDLSIPEDPTITRIKMFQKTMGSVIDDSIAESRSYWINTDSRVHLTGSVLGRSIEDEACENEEEGAVPFEELKLQTLFPMHYRGELTFQVPEENIRQVLGNCGRTLEVIKRTSNTLIRVDQQRSNEDRRPISARSRTVTILGTIDQMVIAAKLIEAKIIEYNNKKKMLLRNINEKLIPRTLETRKLFNKENNCVA